VFKEEFKFEKGVYPKGSCDIASWLYPFVDGYNGCVEIFFVPVPVR
jgi:hypothetical protein